MELHAVNVFIALYVIIIIYRKKKYNNDFENEFSYSLSSEISSVSKECHRDQPKNSNENDNSYSKKMDIDFWI